MTVPLDNLYDYIFSLTNHTNKNLIMYRFDPHGEKDIKNLIVHNDMEQIWVKLADGSEKPSFHYKQIFCHDQEPLDYEYYANGHDMDSRRKLFEEVDGVFNDSAHDLGQKLILSRNFAGHPAIPMTLYDKRLLLHSEKNSEDLVKYEKNGFLGVYYWAHALISLDWYRYAKHDNSLTYDLDSGFEKDFNIYTRAWTGSREYRLKFLELVSNYNINTNSNIFFNPADNEIHYSQYTPKEKKWKVNNNTIDKLDYDVTRQATSDMSARYNSEDFQSSAIDVVLETVFDKNKIHLTEKILRPIACGKPFILVAENGALEYLRSYGFKTFGNLIDESYGTISNPEDRLSAIVHTMKKISDLSVSEKTELFAQMHEIAQENKKWFFSDDFFNLINTELRQNLHAALEALDNPKYITGKEIKFYCRSYKLFKDYLPRIALYILTNLIPKLEERMELSRKYIGIS